MEDEILSQVQKKTGVTYVTLQNPSGTQMRFMDIGATWLNALIPVQGQVRDVVLGTSSLDDQMLQKAYLGATVGRYANRIGRGQFRCNGRTYQVGVNNNRNSLHGGPVGFDKRRWTIAESTEQSVTFSLLSRDGDQGFPGDLTLSVRFELTDDNELIIDYRASTDLSCPVNLTNHAYFNLMGAETDSSVLDHTLEIKAAYYLPVDSEAIPLGHWASVMGTSFDFTQSKVLARDLLQDAQQQKVGGYDHCFIMNPIDCDARTVIARLTAPDGSLTMEVKTSKPGMQLYTGNFLEGTPGRDGHPYSNHSGVALETQYLPDAPNHPEWDQSDPFLHPGKVYKHRTVYRFVAQSE